MSNADLVFQYTADSGAKISSSPEPMTRPEVEFIVGMVVSELMELSQTVMTADEARELVTASVETDFAEYDYTYSAEHSITAAQADAAVDIWYYLLNAFSKKRVNLSKVFDVVHKANLAKKVHGKFVIRNDGKILKPVDWTPPDIDAEILRQIRGDGRG